MTPDELMRQAHLQDEVERLTKALVEVSQALGHEWDHDDDECGNDPARWATHLAWQSYGERGRQAHRRHLDRIAELKAVLTAARNLIRFDAENVRDPGDHGGLDASIVWDALAEAVKAADATYPTERTTIDADAPNPRSQGRNP